MKFPNHITMMKSRYFINDIATAQYEMKMIPWWWVFSKWARWLLEFRMRLVPHFQTVETVTYTNLTVKPLIHNIMIAINQLRRDEVIANRDRLKIIMGQKEFEEFTLNKEVYHNFKFETGPMYYEGEYLDVKVFVYPWIEGWAVIT